jgi:p-aminobenzoyl-glutamate transporter AbgT
MEELKNIERVSPSPFLKRKIMDRIEELSNEIPKAIKWVAVAAFIVNIIVIAQYVNSDIQNEDSDYQIFTTETTINY